MDKKIILCDIDGTLANLEHRLHFISGARKDYTAFFNAMKYDVPINDVIDVVSALSARYLIIFVSGRPDSHRSMTEQWLKKHVPFISADSAYVEVYMRKAGDYRPDYIVKKEIYEQVVASFPCYQVLGVFDDRPQVIEKCWRPLGVTVYKVGAWDVESQQRTRPPQKPDVSLLIGPSRAGKSSYLNSITKGSIWASSCVLSSDGLRQAICGEWTNQEYNSLVFSYIQEAVALRCKYGLPTAIDATNIRDADRKSILNRCTPDTVIDYLVFDRPLEDKVRDRGDVPEAVVRRHHATFQSNLKSILSGDGDSRVSVRDLRSKSIR